MKTSISIPPAPTPITFAEMKTGKLYIIVGGPQDEFIGDVVYTNATRQVHQLHSDKNPLNYWVNDKGNLKVIPFIGTLTITQTEKDF